MRKMSRADRYMPYDSGVLNPTANGRPERKKSAYTQAILPGGCVLVLPRRFQRAEHVPPASPEAKSVPIKGAPAAFNRLEPGQSRYGHQAGESHLSDIPTVSSTA